MADIEWRFCKDCRHLTGINGDLCGSPRITPNLVDGSPQFVNARVMRERTAEGLGCGRPAVWFELRPAPAELSIADQLRAQKAAAEVYQ